ncbi:hydroxyneurosporene-O-methyltransferase [Mycobacterium simiae]|nr:hydroxyneurosporene-O-methyltransferase [Mycobacterium simiae]
MTDLELGPKMLDLLGGFVLSQALFAVAELGVANVLLDGPRAVDDIASAVGAKTDPLGRIIRFLARHEIFHTRDDTVELTALGRTLADGHAGSLRKLAGYFRRTHYAAFGGLADAVRTGQPAATLSLGKPFFEWINDDPELAELQNETMAAFTRGGRGDLLDRYDLPAGTTVADIGGADGSLLVELLDRRPERRGIVYDLPTSVAAARRTVQAAGLADRVTVRPGDFFESVPTADVYVLSAVLQDWDDAPALRILANIAAAAPADARLVVFDMVVPDGAAQDRAALVDILMLGMVGGRQRSLSEWHHLLARGGFALERTVTGSGSYCALEAALA